MYFYKITKNHAFIIEVEKDDFGYKVIKKILCPSFEGVGNATYKIGKNEYINSSYVYEKNFYLSINEIFDKIKKYKKFEYIIETLFTGSHKIQNH